MSATQLLDRSDSLYTDLPEAGLFIRLLTILPGGKGDTIECILRPVSLVTHPQYDALSYVWEQESGDRQIQVNGLVQSIRTNLCDLLKHVRLEQQPRDVWVDALCIRQDSIAEKSEQVRRIHLTFRGAKSVIVWLGVAANQSDTLFEAFRCNARDTSKWCSQWLSPDTDRWLWDYFVLLAYAFKALLARPYWKRTWIIQEVYLATNLYVQCGDAVITGHELYLGHTSLYGVGRDIKLGMSRTNGPAPTAAFDASHRLVCVSIADRVIEYMNPQVVHDNRKKMLNVFQVIMYHVDSQCYDIRDKIFSLQNMLLPPGDWEPTFPFVSVDYGISKEDLLCNVMQVWSRITTFFDIQQMLQILNLEWSDLRMFSQTRQTTPQTGLSLQFQTIGPLQVTTIWTSEKSEDYSLFEVRWGDNSVQFLTRSPLCIQQEVLLFAGAERPAAILGPISDGPQRSLRGAVSSRRFEQSSDMNFDEHEIEILEPDFFNGRPAYQRQRNGLRRWMVELSLHQTIALGSLGSELVQSGTKDTNQPKVGRMLTVKWQSPHLESDISVSDLGRYPIIVNPNGESHELSIVQRAPKEVIANNNQRLQSIDLPHDVVDSDMRAFS